MFTSERRAGRLIELRVVTPFTAGEMDELLRTQEAIAAAIDGPYVVAADMRRVHVFPPEITDRFISLMTHLNPRLLRSGVLINDSALLGLQAARAIGEAGNPNRRAFRDAEAMLAWLAEILTAEERDRLALFLQQSAAAPSPRQPRPL